MTEDQQRKLEGSRPAQGANPSATSREDLAPATATDTAAPDSISISAPGDWPVVQCVVSGSPPPFPKEAAEAAERVWLIEESLACFRLGCVSLVPAAGVFPAFMTLRRFSSVQKRGCKIWNPARRHLFGGVWLAVIGCATSTVLLAWLSRLLRGGDGALLFLILAVPVPMVVATFMTLCSVEKRRALFNHQLIWFLGILIAIVLAEWTLFAFSSKPEPWAWPAVGVSVPFAMWAITSIVWRDANESFRDYPDALLGWLLLAAVFAVQGMLALVEHRPLSIAMALVLPLSLAVRLAGAVVLRPVRQACLRSVAMHVTWTLLSIPFLGAAAHLAGLWDGSVAGVDLARLLRLQW